MDVYIRCLLLQSFYSSPLQQRSSAAIIPRLTRRESKNFFSFLTFKHSSCRDPNADSLLISITPQHEVVLVPPPPAPPHPIPPSPAAPLEANKSATVQRDHGNSYQSFSIRKRRQRPPAAIGPPTQLQAARTSIESKYDSNDVDIGIRVNETGLCLPAGF